jgi:hypothetical protein
MELTKPPQSTISSRVARYTEDPSKHRIEGMARGPMPILAALELYLVAYVEEAAKVGIYMNTIELCQKMADPCYPTRSAEQVVGSLCDAYGYHWDKEFFVGIMGVPNATGLWQVADIKNNGILKIKWVQAKRIFLRLKREDLMKPKEQRRVPEMQHDKLVRTGVVFLLNMVFASSHCDVATNQRTIAASGVAPFTKRLLNYPRGHAWLSWPHGRPRRSNRRRGSGCGESERGGAKPGGHPRARQAEAREGTPQPAKHAAGRRRPRARRPGGRRGSDASGHGRGEGQRRGDDRGRAADEQPRRPRVHRRRRQSRCGARRRC